jgi:hypothetical protein
LGHGQHADYRCFRQGAATRALRNPLAVPRPDKKSWWQAEAARQNRPFSKVVAAAQGLGTLEFIDQSAARIGNGWPNCRGLWTRIWAPRQISKRARGCRSFQGIPRSLKGSSSTRCSTTRDNRSPPGELLPNAQRQGASDILGGLSALALAGRDPFFNQNHNYQPGGRTDTGGRYAPQWYLDAHGLSR